MLHFVRGDMFARPHTVRVNPVNCVGVMGKGLALAFAQRYPLMAGEYKRACMYGQVRPGTVHLARVYDGLVLNVPTKVHWRDKSSLHDVELGLQALRYYLDDMGPEDSVALPPLGCGLGGLRWADVRPLVVQYLGDLLVDVWVYEPA